MHTVQRGFLLAALVLANLGCRDRDAPSDTEFDRNSALGLDANDEVIFKFLDVQKTAVQGELKLYLKISLLEWETVEAKNDGTIHKENESLTGAQRRDVLGQTETFVIGKNVGAEKWVANNTEVKISGAQVNKVLSSMRNPGHADLCATLYQSKVGKDRKIDELCIDAGELKAKTQKFSKLGFRHDIQLGNDEAKLRARVQLRVLNRQ